MDLALRDGIDTAIRVARRFGPGLTEESLGEAGSGLHSAGKPSESIAFMRYRCERYPSSWVAQKLLADRLLDDGDRDRALAGYRKAQQLIASGAKPPASERARRMIADSLKKAEGK
jgi:hypothetical protein